jgi:hypothetical protein
MVVARKLYITVNATIRQKSPDRTDGVNALLRMTVSSLVEMVD